jgi:hypothetical protein
MINPDKLVEGKLDESMFDDPALFVVDDDIDKSEDAEYELLKQGDLSDSEMIDIISGDEPVNLGDDDTSSSKE